MSRDRIDLDRIAVASPCPDEQALKLDVTLKVGGELIGMLKVDTKP